jgi:hypothetical protein
MRIYLRAVIGAEYEELDLVPFWLEHYLRLGVSEFKITIHSESKKSKKANELKDVLQKYSITPVREWVGVFSEYQKIYNLNESIQGVDSQSWIISADPDEFQIYSCELQKFISKVEEQKAEYVGGGLVDKISQNRKINLFNKTINPEKQFPIECNMHNLKKKKGCESISGKVGCYQPKIVLHKKYITLGNGMHYIGEFHSPSNIKYKKFSQTIQVNHYKWHGDILQKMQKMMLDDKQSDYPTNIRKQEFVNYLTKNEIINPY